MFSSICCWTKFGKFPRQRIFQLFRGPFLCREVATVVHPPMKEAPRGHQSVVCPPSQWPRCEIRRKKITSDNGADKDTVHAWRASKEEGGGGEKGFCIISWKYRNMSFEKNKIISFENADLRNLIKARRGEIEPTHDFTFSLIGRLLLFYPLQNYTTILPNAFDILRQ